MAFADGVVLPSYPPTGVRTGHNVHEPLAVALIAIVVSGEEISEFVECGLRVAQAAHDEFQIGSIGLASEDAPLVGEVDNGTTRGVLNARPAVADGEVESSVGPEG